MTAVFAILLYGAGAVMAAGLAVKIRRYATVPAPLKIPVTPAPTSAAGVVWRLVLTSGAGLIFGVLAAREAYDVILFAPLFIVMSLTFGLALFIPLMAASRGTVGDQLISRLGRLLGIFVAVLLAFVILQHMVNFYVSGRTGVERFILMEGGAVTAAFWGGQIILGALAPLALLFGAATRQRILIAAGLVAAGGLAQIYVIVIGGQAYPLTLFPGMEVTSSFFDGVVNRYSPSLAEFGLGLGGCAVAALITLIGLRILPFLPVSLAATQADEKAPS